VTNKRVSFHLTQLTLLNCVTHHGVLGYSLMKINFQISPSQVYGVEKHRDGSFQQGVQLGNWSQYGCGKGLYHLSQAVVTMVVTQTGSGEETIDEAQENEWWVMGDVSSANRHRNFR
jgi:hypothetical protein